MSGAKRGRKSTDGTRAPETIDEAWQNEILRSSVKYVHKGFFPKDDARAYRASEYINHYGLTKTQAAAVINREPRNELERLARQIIDPHRTQGGGRGENRRGAGRQAAELADYFIALEGLTQAQAVKKAIDLLASADVHTDPPNVCRELAKMKPKFLAEIADISALP